MYLKVVRYSEPEGNPQENLLECRSIWHGKILAGEFDGNFAVEVDGVLMYFSQKECASFFVMNNEGKTIDSFMWTPIPVIEEIKT